MRYKETNPFLTNDPKEVYARLGDEKPKELSAPVTRYEFELLKKRVAELEKSNKI